MPTLAWQVASNADGVLHEHADVVDITNMLDRSGGVEQTIAELKSAGLAHLPSATSWRTPPGSP